MLQKSHEVPSQRDSVKHFTERIHQIIKNELIPQIFLNNQFIIKSVLMEETT